MKLDLDLEEGSLCPACRKRRLDFDPPDDCSCHINPPCFACTERGLVCPACGWRQGDDLPKPLGEEEVFLHGAAQAWNGMAAEEGVEVARAHAERVIGSEAAGHWCNCFPEQREAARRFLKSTSAPPETP